LKQRSVGPKKRGVYGIGHSQRMAKKSSVRSDMIFKSIKEPGETSKKHHKELLVRRIKMAGDSLKGERNGERINSLDGRALY